MKKGYRLFLTLILLIFIFNNLSAQNTGKIVGTVLDAETNEPLIGANIIIEGTILGATSDIDGTFIILRVPPGTYEVHAQYIGYNEVVMKDVKVLTDLTTTLNFKLSPEVIQGEQVVVVAETPIVRKDLTSVEARVQAEDIDKMAVQELGDVLNLQAGISRDQDGGIHIRGGRSTEVSYRINGISITDDFFRNQALIVENESIQELQVISGTFNAEYGDAMSGIINIVTKTGGSEWRGDAEVWSGDYLSNRDNIFFNIDDFNIAENYNISGTLSGPIYKNKIAVFLTGRRYYDDGYLYGAKAYLPNGTLPDAGEGTLPTPNIADSSAVPMNFKDRWSGQATLSWQILNSLKLKVDAIGSREERRNYDHAFKLIPTGDRGDDERGISIINNLSHQLGKSTFHELTVAYKYSELESKLYEDTLDSRYVHPQLLSRQGNYYFYIAGNDLTWFERYTKSWIAKWDITSQLTKRHQVKTGVEFQRDEIYYHDLNIIAATDDNGNEIVPFQPSVPPSSSNNNDEFTREPVKFATYIQDKIEYESLVINIGLRFDLFDPQGKVPVDLTDPNIYNPFKEKNIYRDLNGDGVINVSERNPNNKLTVAEREEYWYRDTEVKTLLSPRLGVGFPISERGVIHFSYGIFQQIPDYSLLYVDDQLKVTTGSGIQGPFGNPDLKPQKTTMYELGLKQQFTDNLAIDVTGFYRDIRDWISTTAPVNAFLSGVRYVRNTNRDLANVLGVTLAVTRRFADHFSFDVDYTFQIAEGTNSDPDQEYNAVQGGAEPTRVLTPLNWDQTHTLNTNLFVGSGSWGASVISRFSSGQPYTPTFFGGTRTGQTVSAGLPENSRNKPNIFTLDLRAYKNFKYSVFNLQLFARIFNLLDAKNPTQVYGDTGLADKTFEERVDHDPTWFVNPSFYSPPRSIQVGLRLSYK